MREKYVRGQIKFISLQCQTLLLNALLDSPSSEMDLSQWIVEKIFIVHREMFPSDK